MAKNLLDKALNVLGLKPPTAADYYDPSVYKAEVIKTEPPREISTVEKYQQKKIANSSSIKDKKLSGVAKYLAEKQQPEQEKITPEIVATPEKLTGVAKYLATRQVDEQLAFDNMTGVAKYLYNLNNNKIQLETTPEEKTETPEKLSSVDKYLAKKQGVKLAPKLVTVSGKKATEAPVTIQKARVDDKVKEKTITQLTKNKSTRAIEKPVNKLIDHSAGATQCQAATLKLTQCSHTTSLETIEQTIDEKI